MQTALFVLSLVLIPALSALAAWYAAEQVGKGVRKLLMQLNAQQIEAFVNNVNAKLTEAKTEILAKIEELKAAQGTVEVSPEVAAAMQAIEESANGLADIVPNAAPADAPADGAAQG